MSLYQHYDDQLSSHGIELHPSELHGLLIGYLCAVKGGAAKNQRQAIYRAWIGDEVPAGLAELLEASFASAMENLDEFADFDFTLLIPGDDVSIAERARGVGAWCGGFLAGFGESGRQLDPDKDAEVSEAMSDLAKIAGMTDEVPDSEENEADLMEIVEFVRISALLIFAASEVRGAH